MKIVKIVLGVAVVYVGTQTIIKGVCTFFAAEKVAKTSDDMPA